MKNVLATTIISFYSCFSLLKAQTTKPAEKSYWMPKLYVTAGYTDHTYYLSKTGKPYMQMRTFYVGNPALAAQKTLKSGNFVEIGLTAFNFTKNQTDNYFTDSGGRPFISSTRYTNTSNVGLSLEYGVRLVNTDRFRFYISAGSFFQLYRSREKDAFLFATNSTLYVNGRISTHFQYDISKHLGLTVSFPLLSVLYMHRQSSASQLSSFHQQQMNTLSLFPNRYMTRLGLYCKF